jgi:MFS family permease
LSSGPNPHWRQNLAICGFGSFTTLTAMTIVLPFLPLYVEQLGVRGQAAIVQWSGLVFGATFLTAALVAPVWGRLGDRFGRKPMLVRAGFGMAVTMALIGMVQNEWQLLVLRLLVGLAGGYSSGSMILVATQTPKAYSAWALGMLSSGIMAGNLFGPLVGGALPPLIGIRATFWLAGGVIFVAAVATALFIKEQPSLREAAAKPNVSWSAIPQKTLVVTMLLTGMLVVLANMSIEPIITVYVATFVRDPKNITLIAGLAMSAAALGSILSASPLGRLADRIGPRPVIVGALAASGILLIPQAFVTASWELIALRFLMGVALGSLLPCVASVIRHSVSDHLAGFVLGYSVSSQMAGQVIGPVVGGFVAGHFGMRAVFFGTSFLMLAGVASNALLNRPLAFARAAKTIT